MYKLTIKDKEFEFPTNIGAIKKIETEFNKPILKILDDAENFKIDDYVKVLKSTLTNKEDKEVFKVYSLEEFNYFQMAKIFEEFTNKLFYGDMSEKEIEEKKLQSMKKYKEYKKIKELN